MNAEPNIGKRECVYYDFWGSCGWEWPNPQIFGGFSLIWLILILSGVVVDTLRQGISSVHMHTIKPGVQSIRYEIFFSSCRGCGKWSWHELRAHARTPIYTCLAAINHRIRSCHGVSITFAKRLPTFFDIWKAEPDNFCPAARREETQRKMIMVKESETHICVALKIKSRTGVALKYRPEKEKVTKGMSRNSSLNLILYDASQKRGSGLIWKSALLLLFCLSWDVNSYCSDASLWEPRLSAFHCFHLPQACSVNLFQTLACSHRTVPPFILLSFESFPLQSLQRRFWSEFSLSA